MTFLEAARSDLLYPAFVLAVTLGLRRRAKIAVEVDRELPGPADDGERRQVLEERLRAQAVIAAEGFVRCRERAGRR